MGWYALQEIGEALEETRDMLLPFDIKQLTKLAIIVLLTGSGFNMPTGFGGPSPDGSTGGWDTGSTTVTPETGLDLVAQAESVPEIGAMSGINAATTATVAAVILAVFVFIGLPLLFLSSVFEFIFYRSLIDKEVKIVESFSDNLGRGLRYFGFRVVYTLFVLSTVAVLILLGIENTAMIWLLLLAFVPVLIVLSVFAGLTKNFILLRMMERGEGLIEAWRSFWPKLTSQWKQVIVFLLAHALLSIFVSAVAATTLIGFTVLAAIPVIIMGVLLSLIAEPLFLVPVILGALVWLIVLFYLAVPFRVYMRYYVILVYHDLTS